MDPFFILAIIISTFAFVAIPLSLIWFTYKFIKRKNVKIARFVSYGLLILFVCILTNSFFPSNSFYTQNFVENTELEFPNSEITDHYGNNSIYNFGDYNISYCAKFSNETYANLYSQLKSKGFLKSEIYLETEENENILNSNKSLKIKKILTKNYGFKNFDVLFMDDNKTILFNSNKW